ncbi:hypothetical protein D3C87_1903630 [compost metagenome]
MEEICGKEEEFLRLLLWHFPEAHFLLVRRGAANLVGSIAVTDLVKIWGDDFKVMIEPLDECDFTLHGSDQIVEYVKRDYLK